MTRLFLLAALALSACSATALDGAAVESSDPVASAPVEAAAPAECACVPTTVQDVVCTPHAVCSVCPDREAAEEAAAQPTAEGSEHYYFSSRPGEAFTVAAADCTGSTDDGVATEVLNVKPTVTGCGCVVTIECARARTITLGCE